MRHAIAAALLAALPFAAQAQDRPQIYPTRDVAVTYQVTGRSQIQSGEMTLMWSAAQRLLRMNMPQGLGYMVADQRAQRGFMVIEQMRAIMDVPADRVAGFQKQFESARFTRGGVDRVAGQNCTVWRYQSARGQGEACITADGVMLRTEGNAEGAGEGRMEATRVVYAPQDAALFSRPQGYQSMQLPPGLQPPSGR